MLFARVKPAAIAALLLSMLSLPQTATAATSNASVDAALRMQYAKMVKAVTTNNLELAVSLYDRDTVLLPPKGRILSGLPAVRAYFIEGFSSARTIAETLTPTRRIAANDLVVDVVMIDARIALAGKSAPVNVHGKMLYVWQKTADGTWKLTRDMWSRI